MGHKTQRDWCEGQLQRAVTEIRTAFSSMARRSELAASLMIIHTMLGRCNITVGPVEGEGSFELDEAASSIRFRRDTFELLLARMNEFSDELGYEEEDERQRLVEVAINQFVLHELLHISQNFPHFASVVFIKAGLPKLGLTMLDVAADVVAAWVSAHVECERIGHKSRTDILNAYANSLMIAYVIGTFVFEVIGRAEKIQRALGLITSSLLVKAQADGTLVPTAISSSWKPLSPLIVLDLQAAQAFNAIVVDTLPGMLLSQYDPSHLPLLEELWLSVGQRPLLRTVSVAARVLAISGVIISHQEVQARDGHPNLS